MPAPAHADGSGCGPASGSLQGRKPRSAGGALVMLDAAMGISPGAGVAAGFGQIAEPLIPGPDGGSTRILPRSDEGQPRPIAGSSRPDRRSAQPAGRRARGATAAQDWAGLGAAHELSIQSWRVRERGG